MFFYGSCALNLPLVCNQVKAGIGISGHNVCGRIQEINGDNELGAIFAQNVQATFLINCVILLIRKTVVDVQPVTTLYRSGVMTSLQQRA